MQYHIACLHEQGKATRNEIVSDYHPLTKQEVADLISAAMNHLEKTRIVASVQVRLGQAIKGMECLRPIAGPVAEKLNELNDYYVRNLRFYGNDPSFVDALYAIIKE